MITPKFSVEKTRKKCRRFVVFSQRINFTEKRKAGIIGRVFPAKPRRREFAEQNSSRHVQRGGKSSAVISPKCSIA
jgi:hypothetical protein